MGRAWECINAAKTIVINLFALPLPSLRKGSLGNFQDPARIFIRISPNSQSFRHAGRYIGGKCTNVQLLLKRLKLGSITSTKKLGMSQFIHFPLHGEALIFLARVPTPCSLKNKINSKYSSTIKKRWFTAYTATPDNRTHSTLRKMLLQRTKDGR